MEEVRKRFRDQGQTYDEAAKEEYRRNLVRVFYAKKLVPRVQVTADDMRRYYDRNLDSQFTQHDTLTFRVIKITTQAMGSDALARKKADELAARANRGEDFATIAGEINHDPMLLRAKGLTGPIDRGAYKLEKVEAALLAINPGDSTPVVTDVGGYYIAHLEARTRGRVEPFEENSVQRRVYETLQREQLARMRRDFEGQLLKDAVVAKNDSIFATAVSMAMQNYPKWHR
jgi:parvulin-like peptidyl-prolyl isomerase